MGLLLVGSDMAIQLHKNKFTSMSEAEREGFLKILKGIADDLPNKVGEYFRILLIINEISQQSQLVYNIDKSPEHSNSQ